MPFGAVSGIGQGMGVLDGVKIVEGREGAVLEVNVGHPIVTNVDLWRTFLRREGWRRGWSQITEISCFKYQYGERQTGNTVFTQTSVLLV